MLQAICRVLLTAANKFCGNQFKYSPSAGTTTRQIEASFKEYTQRDDLGIILISQYVRCLTPMIAHDAHINHSMSVYFRTNEFAGCQHDSSNDRSFPKAQSCNPRDSLQRLPIRPHAGLHFVSSAVYVWRTIVVGLPALLSSFKSGDACDRSDSSWCCT
jgi:hypothetical protein